MALRVTRLLLPAGGFALEAGRAAQKVSPGTEPVPPGLSVAKSPTHKGRLTPLAKLAPLLLTSFFPIQTGT